MSDVAAQVSSRAWTCSPAISSYIYKMVRVLLLVAPSNAPWTGATWTDQCFFVSIDDIIIYSRNAVEHIYHVRLVSERLTGIKIKPADGKQKSMKYSSETEASEHSLAGGVIQYIYYIFSILLSSLHAVEAYIRHIRSEFCSISIYYLNFFIVICDGYLELCIHV